MIAVHDILVAEKNIIVRVDLEWTGENCPRRQATLDIIEYLRTRGAERIKVIGHKGNIDQVIELGVDINFDLRSDPREEANDESLAVELALGWDVYINESFATSHRKHCSIDALPRLMKSSGKQVGVGLRFEIEIEKLKVVDKGLLIIGGAKTFDKAKCADELEKKGWTVLRGGLLSGVDLRPDGLDISGSLISNYQSLISTAQTIVVAGPMGKYEEVPEGTKKIFTAVANSKAYKVAGGGDTEAALEKFKLKNKFDWISVGGGAMLEYLSSGTLVGIEALT
ncbi:phosphoglycerate kinase [Candidatus Amesbacteria bacterium]|nr:phosphoglycerate kinase [Candidatus Amesbacteria bacterium]